MTAAERAVLARYPDAECWRDLTWQRDGNGSVTTTAYTIFEDPDERATVLGTGPTPDAAWADAASRLDPPVAPPDGTR